MYWWVNQGKTFYEACSQGILWVPQKDKRGGSRFHWENMKELQLGDIVFCYAKSEIKALIKITHGAIESNSPFFRKQWQLLGWKAKGQYSLLKPPVPLERLSKAAKNSLKFKYGPLNYKFTGNQSYLLALGRDIHQELLDIIPAELREN